MPRSLYTFTFVVYTLLQAAAASADISDEILACRNLDADIERLECYDNVADRNTQANTGEQSPAVLPIPAASVAVGATAAADTELNDAADSEPSATADSEPNAAVVSQEDLFGKDVAEIELAIEEASGNEALDQLDARIVGVRKVGPSRVAITLDNEQVWRQTQSSSLRLSEGDEVVISKASMGSHMLRKVGSNRAMRVERVD